MRLPRRQSRRSEAITRALVYGPLMFPAHRCDGIRASPPSPSAKSCKIAEDPTAVGYRSVWAAAARNAWRIVRRWPWNRDSPHGQNCASQHGRLRGHREPRWQCTPRGTGHARRSRSSPGHCHRVENEHRRALCQAQTRPPASPPGAIALIVADLVAAWDENAASRSGRDRPLPRLLLTCAGAPRQAWGPGLLGLNCLGLVVRARG